MVNLAEAQKVFNLVQGLSKQQQFVKYISNAGLLSVLLESITKGNGAGATFLVPSPDALQSLPPASPYFNNPSLARTTLRYHMILGKQMDYTALVERPADTGFRTLAKESMFKSDESAFFRQFPHLTCTTACPSPTPPFAQFPTLAKESMFKSDESAFFTVVFRSGSGRSKSTLLAPNLAKTEFFQVHLVDSQLVPDAILHSVPDGGSAADGSDRSGGSSSGGDSTGAGSLSPPPSVPSPSVPSPPLNPSPPPTVSSPPPVNPSPPPPSPSPPPPESSPPPPVSSPPTPDSSSPSAPIESTQATTPPSPSPPPPTNESTSSATPSPP
ncbi:unnamed protein product [Closterium sp. NIES-64]|nr:unnamed protein product [Closterium sp. NIES-64]